MNNPDEPTTKTLDLKMVIPDLTKTVQYLLNEVSTLKEQLLTQSNLISNLQSQINI
jgi:archaellum component FlaC